MCVCVGGAGGLWMCDRLGLPCFCKWTFYTTGMSSNLKPARVTHLYLYKNYRKVIMSLRERACAFTFYSFDIIYRFQLWEGEGGVAGSRNPATLTCRSGGDSGLLTDGWVAAVRPTTLLLSFDWRLTNQWGDRQEDFFFVLLKSKRNQIPSVPLRPDRTC